MARKVQLPDREDMAKYATKKQMPMGTKVTDDFYAAFKQVADELGLSLSVAIREALYDWADWQLNGEEEDAA